MFKLVVEKELRDIIGSTKFAVTFGVCALLILIAFFMGARNYNAAQSEFEASRIENLKQLDGLTTDEWYRVQPRIFLPPEPLAALVSGVSNDVGRTITVTGRGELNAEDSRYNDVPIYAVFRLLDLEFIFTIVLSLFAILFAYDAVNGEKERGTLRLAFANAVPRDTYILGKLTGSFLALAIPLLIPILLGSLLLPILGVPMEAEDWSRLALVVVAGMLYFGVFLTLSVFVSSVTQRSASAFLMLLVIWIGAVMILPRAAVLFAGRAVEVPSVDEIAYQKRQMRAQFFEEDMQRLAESTSGMNFSAGGGAMRMSFSSSGEDAAEQARRQQQAIQDFMQKQNELADERTRKMDEFSGKLNEERRNRQLQQEKLAFNLARVSPSSSFSLAAMNLAGTSLTLQERFLEAAKSYQQAFDSFLREKTGGQSTGGSGFVIRMRSGSSDEEEEEPEPIDPNELPAFHYPAPPLQAYVGPALLDFGILAFFNVLFFAGAFMGFLRYDVR